MANDCPDSVKAILAELDVPLALIAERSLVFQPEAVDLVVAETEATGRKHLLVRPAADAWQAMQAAAAADGVPIRIVSAFRTVERQAQIVRAKLQSGLPLDAILRVSAPPGYSEHHSGRAVDLTTDGIAPLEEAFEGTPAFAWLAAKAHEFSYSLSFPTNNRWGYAYEPWHWCFEM